MGGQKCGETEAKTDVNRWHRHATMDSIEQILVHSDEAKIEYKTPYLQ